MSQIELVKGHVNGSDVIAVLPGIFPALTPAQIAQLCDRNAGVGAHFLVTLAPVEDTPEADAIRKEHPDVRWDGNVYNQDGERTSQISSALQVAANALKRFGYDDVERRDTLPIVVGTTIHDILIGIATTSIDLGRWKLGEEQLVRTAQERVPRPGLLITVDVGYTVVAVPSLHELEALRLAETVEVQPEQSREHMVVFVTPNDSVIKNGVGQIIARTHSSTHGEVPATGSALAAAALAFRHWGGPEMPNHWRVTTQGMSAAVRMFPTEEGEHVSTAAPVSLVLRGETLPD